MRVEAEGFEAQERDSVTAGLGQTQTANFTLTVASARQDVIVNGERRWSIRKMRIRPRR